MFVLKVPFNSNLLINIQPQYMLKFNSPNTSQLRRQHWYIYKVAPKKVSHYQVIKNRIKSYYNLSMKLDLLVKLKYESSTIILFDGIRYSVRDLLSDLNNYAWPANRRYASNTVNDVNASCGISSP